MDIEAVAHDTPEAIVKVPIDINTGLTRPIALKLAKELTFENQAAEEV